MNLSYEVETNYNSDNIRQLLWSDFNGSQELLYTKIIHLQEQGIRDALIKLGWTPPKEHNEPSN